MLLIINLKICQNEIIRLPSIFLMEISTKKYFYTLRVYERRVHVQKCNLIEYIDIKNRVMLLSFESTDARFLSDALLFTHIF